MAASSPGLRVSQRLMPPQPSADLHNTRKVVLLIRRAGSLWPPRPGPWPVVSLHTWHPPAICPLPSSLQDGGHLERIVLFTLPTEGQCGWVCCSGVCLCTAGRGGLKGLEPPRESRGAPSEGTGPGGAAPWGDCPPACAKPRVLAHSSSRPGAQLSAAGGKLSGWLDLNRPLKQTVKLSHQGTSSLFPCSRVQLRTAWRRAVAQASLGRALLVPEEQALGALVMALAGPVSF